MREQAAEALTHAQQAGEMITLLGEYPSLTIGPLLDTYQHDVEAIMRESLESEAKALALYCDPKAPKRSFRGDVDYDASGRRRPDTFDWRFTFS